MNDAWRKQIYFPCWHACARVNGWRLVDGRLSAEARRDSSLFHALVWRHAGQIAVAEHRAITPEDLRHAVNLTATTHLKEFRKSTKATTSISDMDRAALDHVLCLIGEPPPRDSEVKRLWKRGLLVDPDDLYSNERWDDPSLDEADRCLWVLHHCVRGVAYVQAIAANIYGTRNLENLRTDLGALRNLCGIIGRAQKSWSKPVEGGARRSARAVAGIEEPY